MSIFASLATDTVTYGSPGVSASESLREIDIASRYHIAKVCRSVKNTAHNIKCKFLPTLVPENFQILFFPRKFFEKKSISKIFRIYFFKVNFLHEEKIFFDEIFFKPHLLIFSFPTRPFSASSEQNGTNGSTKRVHQKLKFSFLTINNSEDIC